MDAHIVALPEADDLALNLAQHLTTLLRHQ